MQTWLVHMRRPVGLAREIGIRQFVGFNLVGAGMIVSALVHPIYLACLAMLLADPVSLWRDRDPLMAVLIGVNLFNLGAGYAATILLARRTLALRRRASDLSWLAALPLYWLLMALACLRGLWQLLNKPHVWEKTPHRASASLAPCASPRRGEAAVEDIGHGARPRSPASPATAR